MRIHLFLLGGLLLSSLAHANAAPHTFSIQTHGQGEPMVFIPGLTSSGAVWQDTVKRFADRYECHVLTLAGFAGTAPYVSDQPFLASVRDELAAYITERQLEQPVIVGHSLGGVLALDLAIHHPQLPGRLVIVDSLPFIVGIMQPGATMEDARRVATATVQSFSAMSAERYAQMIRSGPNGSTMATRAEDIDRIIAWGLASDAPTVAKAMHELYTTDLRGSLSAITAPTLVIAAWIGYAPYASHDYIDRIYREQYAQLAGVRIEITDTSRHFVMLDEPAQFAETVNAFLASTPSAPGSHR
ncbi:MAG TPA: alpha/beta hydrolase [Candidatus Synoicihabitans sp.]|nr:alpha/beta hydrolase [Candidatus Synoicihabitans sp.]